MDLGIHHQFLRCLQKDCAFQHITSSTDYPRSNGLAEKTVQTMKNLFEKAKGDNKDPHPTMLEA